jgi:hypothetical protein
MDLQKTLNRAATALSNIPRRASTFTILVVRAKEFVRRGRFPTTAFKVKRR